jgi:hypothetical protein
MNPTFDERDAEILREREAEWNKRQGPRVGDFVIMPNNEVRRFTYDWGDDIQTTHPKFSGDVSFYFSGDCMSFSGSLDHALPKSAMVDTGETRPGRAWFFHHNESGAHRGVYFWIDCRVYRYTPDK